MANEFSVSTYVENELTRDVAESIAILACRSFIASTKTVEQRRDDMIAAVGKSDPEITSSRRYVVWDHDRAIAHARTFIRMVFVDGQPVPVLGLASVCSDPDVRGAGLGVRVTRKAFELVGQTHWPDVSLFQTPVPGFYERLDCRLVENRFVNRRNLADPESRPWRDPYVMIYPREFAWPAGVVDLNGPDY